MAVEKESSDEEKVFKLPAEKSVGKTGEDLLSFTDKAKRIATILQHCQTPQLISLYGKWGSGKSSMLDFIEKELENNSKILKVRFNSWDHENEKGLIPSLLFHIHEAIPEGNKKARKSMREVLSTVGLALTSGAVERYVGISIPEIINIIKDKENSSDSTPEKLPEDQHGNLSEVLRNALIELKTSEKIRRIVLLIDDVDRCHPENIWNFIDGVRKLSALTDNMEKKSEATDIVGLMALDRDIINSAISAKYPAYEGDPSEYFFKIFSASIYVPKPDTTMLVNFLSTKTEEFEINFHPSQLTFLAKLENETEGFITLRHYTTFLRHYSLWQIPDKYNEDVKS